LIIHILPDAYSYLTVRVNPEGTEWPTVLENMEHEWKTLGMKGAFTYFFLDEDFAKQYESDQRLKTFISYFSGLAIVIGCLGLFGLAVYTTRQRSKEIGIRKVLGATAFGLVGLLSLDFLKLVLMANLIAWPLAWYLLTQWLSNFAYHIDVSLVILFLSGFIALLIAWLTVGFESIKAALQNPVESLHHE
jgi:putative ABC transport system permease protein